MPTKARDLLNCTVASFCTSGWPLEEASLLPKQYTFTSSCNWVSTYVTRSWKVSATYRTLTSPRAFSSTKPTVPSSSIRSGWSQPTPKLLKLTPVLSLAALLSPIALQTQTPPHMENSPHPTPQARLRKLRQSAGKGLAELHSSELLQDVNECPSRKPAYCQSNMGY